MVVTGAGSELTLDELGTGSTPALISLVGELAVLGGAVLPFVTAVGVPEEAVATLSAVLGANQVSSPSTGPVPLPTPQAGSTTANPIKLGIKPGVFLFSLRHEHEAGCTGLDGLESLVTMSFSEPDGPVPSWLF